MDKKKRLFSGIKPTGRLNIGGYIGAVSQWLEMQEKYESIFCVVDYHAITVKQDPEQLQQRTRELVRSYLAAGIDPEKCSLFLQSEVPAHTELAWVLNCCAARVADLNKMTQFKDKAGKNQESATVGLYDYPVLMAADILLYDTVVVPVGEDQRQHVELARDLARRFNKEYGDAFVIPEAVVRPEGARIMSLQDPKKKMSKSDESGAGCIELLDDIEEAKKKIMRALTDSGSEIEYDPENRPAISNLLTIYARLGGRQIPRLVKDYKGKGYGDFKRDLAEVVAKFLEDFQSKYYKISDEDVDRILAASAAKMRELSEKKMELVRRLIGIR